MSYVSVLTVSQQKTLKTLKVQSKRKKKKLKIEKFQDKLDLTFLNRLHFLPYDVLEMAYKDLSKKKRYLKFNCLHFIFE